MKDSAITLSIPPEHAGRLDKALGALIPDISRVRLQKLITAGHVEVAGALAKNPAQKLKGGEEITITLPAAVSSAVLPEKIKLDVVYEDAHLLVVNKPAGLVVHPGAGHPTGTLVNALLAHCGKSLSGIGGVERPGIVHRLDAGTSGLLVVAKTDAAHKGLSKQFEGQGAEAAAARLSAVRAKMQAAEGRRVVEKYVEPAGNMKELSRIYHAFVWGVPQSGAGFIDAAIGRSTANRKKMAVKSGGKHARTHYEVKAAYGMLASQIELKLETGRTHQIRVHLAHLGHGTIGDPSYGKARGHRSHSALKKLTEKERDTLLDFNRPALHAAELSFTHPISGKKMHFKAPLPKDLRALEKILEKL